MVSNSLYEPAIVPPAAEGDHAAAVLAIGVSAGAELGERVHILAGGDRALKTANLVRPQVFGVSQAAALLRRRQA